MKKVFALVLAASMVASMASVSFAAKNETHEGVTNLGDLALTYSADKNTMSATSATKVVQYGKAAYFPLVMDDAHGDYVLVSKQSMVDGLKIKAKFEMGEEIVADQGISVVKKQVKASTISGGEIGDIVIDKDGYYYFIEVKTTAKETTSDADIIATLTLNKTKDAKDLPGTDSYKVKDFEKDITINVSYEHNFLDSGLDADGAQASELYVNDDTVGDLKDLEPETYYLLKYNYDDEVEFNFGANNAGKNEGTFTVDVSGQGKNLLWFDTIIDEAIAAANPTATKLFALNFNNTKFNRTGEFLYEGEDFEYAYEVMADGSLKLLGEFSGEEITFKTRVLGKYLFSDVELVAAPKAAVDAPVDVTPVPNPSTGAAC